MKIDLGEENFSVSYFSSDRLLKKKQIDYAEIAAVGISEKNNRFSNFTLSLKNGNSLKFIFEDELTGKDGVDSDSELLLSEIYKIAKTRGKSIIIKPTFIASKNGFFMIISLDVCFLLISIYFLFGNPKIVPYSFLISSGFFLQIIGTRIQQRKFYKKLQTKYL